MTDIGKVLCTLPFSDEELRMVERIFAPSEVIFCSDDDDATIRKALEEVDVAVVAGDIDDRFLAAPNLKWVHCGHSGLAKSARPEVFDRGLLVTGSAGRSAAALAQHAFYFALALTFDAKRLFECQANHVWRGIPGYEDKLGLAGKTLGIVGFGHTGREMAALGKAFQMKVVAYNRSARAEADNVDQMLCAEWGDDINQLIDASDVIMLATQLTDQTYHLFSTEEFKRMRDSAFIINMARGPVIDEAALVAALETGEIAGAGLDVFAEEPLPESSPLWDTPNVIITPHQTPKLPDRTQRMIDTLAENVHRYRSGSPLLNTLSRSDVYTPRG